MDIHTDFKKNLLDTDRIDEVEFNEYKNNYSNTQDVNDTNYSGQFGNTDKRDNKFKFRGNGRNEVSDRNNNSTNYSRQYDESNNRNNNNVSYSRQYGGDDDSNSINGLSDRNNNSAMYSRQYNDRNSINGLSDRNNNSAMYSRQYNDRNSINGLSDRNNNSAMYSKQYDESNNRNNNLDTDYIRQFGGKNENLNYLDDYTSAQYNSKRLDSYEKEFMDMYNKAREFRQRVVDVENKQKNIDRNQYGGQDATKEKKSRPLHPAIRLMQELTKIMRNSGKYPELKQTQFIKISKMIVDDAKKQTGMQEINDTVRQSALQLVKNSDKYVQRFKSEQSGTEKTDNKSSSNSRGNSNKVKNFRNQTDSKDSYTGWKGSDSNYRNYAQEDLWNDKNMSTKNSYNDRDNNSYNTRRYNGLNNDRSYTDDTNYDVNDRVQNTNSSNRNKNSVVYKKKSNQLY